MQCGEEIPIQAGQKRKMASERVARTSPTRPSMKTGVAIPNKRRPRLPSKNWTAPLGKPPDPDAPNTPSYCRRKGITGPAFGFIFSALLGDNIFMVYSKDMKLKWISGHPKSVPRNYFVYLGGLVSTMNWQFYYLWVWIFCWFIHMFGAMSIFLSGQRKMKINLNLVTETERHLGTW